MARIPGAHQCKRHQRTYGALEQCPECVADPGAPPAELKLKLPRPPRGCWTAAEREAWFIELAIATLADVARLVAAAPKSKRRRRGAAKDDEPAGDWHVEVAIKAHRDTAIKAMRAAQELGARREQGELVEARRRANATEAV